jgi:hypothetical protein
MQFLRVRHHAEGDTAVHENKLATADSWAFICARRRIVWLEPALKRSRTRTAKEGICSALLRSAAMLS